MWDLATGKQLIRIGDFPQPVVKTLAFSPDSKVLASGPAYSPYNGVVRVWDCANGKELLRIPILDATTVNALAFTKDGKGLFVGQVDATL